MNNVQHMMYSPSIDLSAEFISLEFLENTIRDNNLVNMHSVPGSYKINEISALVAGLSAVGKVYKSPSGIYALCGAGHDRRTAFVVIANILNYNQAIGFYVGFSIYYGNENVNIISRTLEETFAKCKHSEAIVDIDWCYVNAYGHLNWARFYDAAGTTIIHDEAYPTIEKSIDDYLYDYLQSDAPVLLMIGPPGTGKTRLIKHFMCKAAEIRSKSRLELAHNRMDEVKPYSVLYSNSQSAYNQDELFIHFLSSDHQMMILEDMDLNLASRVEGKNEFMQKLLNASDGIINIGGKKIILTTNILSTAETDSALLRPGRTHDILHTRKLTLSEALILADKIGVEITIEHKDKNEYTLAEIYNNKEDVGV